MLRQHRTLRWLAPVGVVGAVAVVAGSVIAAHATPEPVPPTTPTALLAGMQSANHQGFSGTIVAQISLGLPSLPGVVSSDSSTSMTSLLAGSHTLRCWYAGPDQQRVALLGTTDETDVFHSGTDLWQWSSSDFTATHVKLPAHDERLAPPTVESLTPEQLATRALAALDPSTTVTVEGTRVVADRTAYVLVLTPKDSSTRVGSVRISVDGRTKVPLGVQVFARGSSSAAVDIEFSDVSFATPSRANFAFTPPPGATVKEGFNADYPEPDSGHPASVIGTGWSSVVEYRAPTSAGAAPRKNELQALPRVSGAWGTGRILDAPLFSVLLTDDGRVFAGAVDPDVLYRAAATHK